MLNLNVESQDAIELTDCTQLRIRIYWDVETVLIRRICSWLVPLASGELMKHPEKKIAICGAWIMHNRPEARRFVFQTNCSLVRLSIDWIFSAQLLSGRRSRTGSQRAITCQGMFRCLETIRFEFNKCTWILHYSFRKVLLRKQKRLASRHIMMIYYDISNN